MGKIIAFAALMLPGIASAGNYHFTMDVYSATGGGSFSCERAIQCYYRYQDLSHEDNENPCTFGVIKRGTKVIWQSDYNTRRDD